MKHYNYGYYVLPIGVDGEEAYEAIIPKFPNIHAYGETLKELHEGVMFGIEEEIKDLKKSGKKIPQEDTKVKFNGKILLRVPSETHKKLYHMALANKISLNKYIESKLK